MIWRDEELTNPFSGKRFRRDSPHSVSDGKNRFPVVEEIPYLRANRDELRGEILDRLDAGDEKAALILCSAIKTIGRAASRRTKRICSCLWKSKFEFARIDELSALRRGRRLFRAPLV
jgi:hypothetical protein